MKEKNKEISDLSDKPTVKKKKYKAKKHLALAGTTVVLGMGTVGVTNTNVNADEWVATNDSQMKRKVKA